MAIGGNTGPDVVMALKVSTDHSNEDSHPPPTLTSPNPPYSAWPLVVTQAMDIDTNCCSRTTLQGTVLGSSLDWDVTMASGNADSSYLLESLVLPFSAVYGPVGVTFSLTSTM